MIRKNYKFDINELYVAEIIRVKSRSLKGDEVVSKYEVIKVGIFQKVGEDKFLHLTSGKVFDKFTSYTEHHELAMNTKNVKPLSIMINNPNNNKISMKYLAELEKRINLVAESERNKDKEMEK